MTIPRLRVATVALAMLAGCASSAGTQDNSSSNDNEALSTRTWSYVTLRADLRKCMAPLCGGYFVRDVNKSTDEQYVSGLDYGPSGLHADDLRALDGAADGELVLRSRFGPKESRFQTRALLVSEAYRGMPGMTVADADVFYTVSPREPQIRCIVAPCPNETASVVNKTDSYVFDGISVAAAAAPFADIDWMVSRVTDHHAIVAAHFENGQHFPGGYESVLTASQLFVRIPDARCHCSVQGPKHCPAGQQMTFDRDADRCLAPSGCVKPGICPLFMPHCADGYSLAGWAVAPNACSAWACDPAFLAK